MKEVLEVIIKNLVSNPESVTINEKIEERNARYEVTVAKSDMGKVIGKQGKIAKSIRSVMKSIAGKEQKRVTIEFLG